HHFGHAQPHRQLEICTTEEFPGGFSTCGKIIEGTNLVLAEGWSGTNSATLQTAFAALPDDHTVVGLHLARMGKRRGYVSSASGLHLNIPNDVYQNHHITLRTAPGDIALQTPAHNDDILNLHSHWAHVPGRVGVIGA